MKATAKATSKNNDLVGWMRKNNHAACAACTLVKLFDILVCQMTRWNSQTYSFNDNMDTQQ